MTTNAMDAPPPTETRRLQRPRDGRMVAGVAQGLGRYFDIDPIIFRIVLGVLVFFGGAGLVLYALGWLLMPEEGAPASHLDNLIARRRFGRRGWPVVLVLIVLVIWALSSLGDHHPAPFVVAIVLIGLVLLLFRERSQHHLAQDETGTTTATATMPPPPVAPTWQPQMPMPMAPPRHRSVLGLATAATALIAAGIVTALAVGGAVDPQPADMFAIMLGIVGAGLLVGAVWGRAYGLIPIGILLVVGLGVARAVPPDVPWTSGDRTWVPTASDVGNRYGLGAGDARLDLTQLTTTHDGVIHARIGAGRLVVVVPSNATVDLRVRAGAGRILIDGNERNGSGLDVSRHLAPVATTLTSVTAASPDELHLDLWIGFGDVEVDRAA
jgi:phage shock protein PspC (stress-responsive transcriptional regulator)